MSWDAHNHIHLHSNKTKQILADAASLGIGFMCVNGTCPNDWGTVAELAAQHAPVVIPNFGLHPYHSAKYAHTVSDSIMEECLAWLREEPDNPIRAPPTACPPWLESLLGLLQEDPAAHVGETGLHKPGAGKGNIASLSTQEQCLQLHLGLAVRLRRTVTVHCVKAYGRLLLLLQAQAAASKTMSGISGTWPLGVPVVCHSYAGSHDMTKQLGKLGAYFSFSGSVTSPKFKAMRQAAQQVPLNRLLLESDCPDQPIAPSYSSQRAGVAADLDGHVDCCDSADHTCETAAAERVEADQSQCSMPSDVLRTAACIANLRECSAQEVLDASNQNARQLFLPS